MANKMPFPDLLRRPPSQKLVSKAVDAADIMVATDNRFDQLANIANPNTRVPFTGRPPLTFLPDHPAGKVKPNET